MAVVLPCHCLAGSPRETPGLYATSDVNSSTPESADVECTRHITIELLLHRFEDLDGIDAKFTDRLVARGLSEDDVEKETAFSMTDALGYSSSELDDLQIASFPVTVEIGLALRRVPPEMLRVVLRMINGREFPVTVPRCASVADLKHEAEAVTGIPVFQQEMLLGRRKLDRDTESPLLALDRARAAEAVFITLLRTASGRMAKLVCELQAADRIQRELAIQTLCEVGPAGMTMLSACLREWATEAVCTAPAKPDFLHALAACVGDLSSSEILPESGEVLLRVHPEVLARQVSFRT